MGIGSHLYIMNKVKKLFLFCLFLGANVLHSLANTSGRGRIDSSGPSDFTAVVFGIFAIIIGGFLAFIFLGGGAQDKYKDQEMNKMGCASIAAIILGIALLVGMCSH